MKKLFCGAFVATLFTANGHAQTLFTISNDSVSVEQFLTAYKKNNAAKAVTTEDLKAYLNLYIAARLKVKEAKSLGLDTLPQLVAELQSLREQIIPSYLNDEAAINHLINEAFVRSQKDIHLHHIFISDKGDSVTAKQKAETAYQALQKGGAFHQIAKQYSDDPLAKTTGGDAGFITVFTLPYAIENLIYNIPSGKAAPIYRSKNGFHIFKNGGERKAAGRIKAAQILLAFPPDATPTIQAAVKYLADSIYNRLQKGDDFGKLATRFSNDVISAASEGQMPEFGIGQYDPVFERAVFDLETDGAFSKPFLTAHGWHIVKRIKRVTQPTGLNEKWKEELREKLVQSDRMVTVKDAITKKVLSEAPLSQPYFSLPFLWSYTDSVLQAKNPVAAINNKLIQLGSKTITLPEWIAYVTNNRSVINGAGATSYATLFWNGFIPTIAQEYHTAHLEEFNPAFKTQLEELKEGALFFEIMQQQVWGPSQTDTVALQHYFNQHPDKYVWKKSADAIVFYAADIATAETVKKEVVKMPQNWKNIVAGLNEKVAADSNRFEIAAIPNGLQTTIKSGTSTAPVINKTDNTASFAYIIKIYNSTEQRTFNEAKGLVSADYSTALEQEWITALKQKYPVWINQKSWNALLKK